MCTRTTSLNITKEVKEWINRKRAVFRNGDRLQLKTVEQELNQPLRAARRRQKEIIEESFAASNSKRLWDSVKAITNMGPSRRPFISMNMRHKMNEVNEFYCRFETEDHS